jgi:hypothetical protein
MFFLMVAAKSIPPRFEPGTYRRRISQCYATTSFSAGLTVPNTADFIIMQLHFFTLDYKFKIKMKSFETISVIVLSLSARSNFAGGSL